MPPAGSVCEGDCGGGLRRGPCRSGDAGSRRGCHRTGVRRCDLGRAAGLRGRRRRRPDDRSRRPATPAEGRLEDLLAFARGCRPAATDGLERLRQREIGRGSLAGAASLLHPRHRNPGLQGRHRPSADRDGRAAGRAGDPAWPDRPAGLQRHLRSRHPRPAARPARRSGGTRCGRGDPDRPLRRTGSPAFGAWARPGPAV